MRFARIDQSLVARWWWTVDRWSLAALGTLICFGVVMSLAASPPVAERIGYDGLHFVRRHLAMLPLALGLMFAVSLQPPRTIRRIALIGFGISLALLALTFVIGAEIKGARRWINFPGLSLQPSEFVKPTFGVVAAWLFSEQKLRPRVPGNLICIALFLLVVAMLIKQPDIGMAAVVAAVWFAQFFMAGMRLYWVAAGALAGVAGLVGAYLYLPHVRIRVDHFLDPSTGDSYQVNRSIEAFANVGLWGRRRHRWTSVPGRGCRGRTSRLRQCSPSAQRCASRRIFRACPGDHDPLCPRRTLPGRRRAHRPRARRARMGYTAGAAPAAPAAPGVRRRFWRLSLGAWNARGRLSRSADTDPRTECSTGPRQSLARAVCRTDRHRLPEHCGASSGRPRARGSHRKPSAAGGPGCRWNEIQGAATRRCDRTGRPRRQPGSPDHERSCAAGSGGPAAAVARGAANQPPGAPRGSSRCRAGL